MTDSVAEEQIVAFVDRILRLKEEERAIKADIREIYAEAKGNGFDKTALGKLVSYVEKREAGANELAEAEAIFDLYLTAYDSAKRPRAHTHARESLSVPSFVATVSSGHEYRYDTETGEITEPQPETAEQSRLVVGTLSADAQFFTSFAGTEGDEGQQPNYGLAGPAYARDDEVANTKPALNSNPASTSPHASLAGEGSSIPQHTPAAPLDNSQSQLTIGADHEDQAAFAQQVDARRRPISLIDGGEHQRHEEVQPHEAPAGRVADESPAPKRQWTYADEPDPRCMNPVGCGGTSRFALCGKCREATGVTA